MLRRVARSSAVARRAHAGRILPSIERTEKLSDSTQIYLEDF
jgi:hypothetical protein